MAIGRVNTGGGGSGGTLTVTGVAGDTVTAAKSGKTYSRTFNSSGIATFKGLATGTWAITMTDGSQTVTQQVTIKADYTLTMAYQHFLIEAGAAKVSFTATNCTANSVSGSMKTTAKSNTAGGVYYATAVIDLTGWSTLGITITAGAVYGTSGTSGANTTAAIGVGKSKPTYDYDTDKNNFAAAKYLPTNGTSSGNQRSLKTGTYSLDVSSLTGTYYVGLAFGVTNAGSEYVSFSNFWLE